jgi:hypothetical protein
MITDYRVGIILCFSTKLADKVCLCCMGRTDCEPLGKNKRRKKNATAICTRAKPLSNRGQFLIKSLTLIVRPHHQRFYRQRLCFRSVFPDFFDALVLSYRTTHKHSSSHVNTRFSQEELCVRKEKVTGTCANIGVVKRAGPKFARSGLQSGWKDRSTKEKSRSESFCAKPRD